LKELLEMKLSQLIVDQKKTVLAMVGVLCVLWFAQTYISEWLGQLSSAGTGKEFKQPAPEISHDATPPAPSSQSHVVDPFREFMAQQANSSKPQLTDTPLSTDGKPVDPFKAHLENQKQQLEAAGVSPFGK
jgi:hypothetical protein